MKIGDIVAPVDGADSLRSGCSYYPQAVVASASPFVLVSEEGDMLWCKQKAESFRIKGRATPAITLQSVNRLFYDLRHGMAYGLVPDGIVMVSIEQELEGQVES
jgi:hypothetical protein